MKLHILTIGEPKLQYAKLGWEEYWSRLQHYHQVRVTHLADKWADDADRIKAAAGSSYTVALEITGQQFTSPELSAWLDKRALEGREICFMIGGPDGLPETVRSSADMRWSFGTLTLPHDLAMVTLVESLYRASTISSGHPYHR